MVNSGVGVRPLRSGAGPYTDNVKRRQELEAANPDVKISNARRDPHDPSWVVTWTGTIVIDGAERTFTRHSLGGLLGKLEPLAEQRAQALGRLKLAWGDHYEDIRVDESGRWRGRRRDGDGRKLNAATADELNAAFRADQEREITW